MKMQMDKKENYTHELDNQTGGTMPIASVETGIQIDNVQLFLKTISQPGENGGFRVAE